MTQIPQFRRGFRFQYEPAQQGHVLLYPEGMVKLNESAGAILGEIDGQRSIADIVARLEQRFPAAGSLQTDVTEFLQDARQQQWIDLL